ncbi:MAG: hypothetical protein ACOCPQ_00245 [Desulfosudaceae bacterium]
MTGAADSWCLPEHAFTPAEIQEFVDQARPPDSLASFYREKQALDPACADLAWQFLTTPEFGMLAELEVDLSTLLAIPGFEKMEGLLTDMGCLLALARFGEYLENQDPPDLMRLARSKDFRADGALPGQPAARAIKNSAVGIGLIDPFLTTFGDTANAGDTEHWYRDYRNYYDDMYGSRLADMGNWEKLIFDTYNGDFKKALTDGLMTFWNEEWRHSYETSGHARAEPDPEAKEQIRQAYLAEILPTLRNYLRVKQNQTRDKIRQDIQYAYNSLKRYLEQPLRFQGVIRTRSGQPLAGVSVDVAGTASATTNDEGLYRLSLRTGRLLAALAESGGRETSLTAAYRPDPPLPDQGGISRVRSLIHLNRRIPNRVDMTFNVVKTRLRINRQALTDGSTWELTVTAQSADGTELTAGEITLTADERGFVTADGLSCQIRIAAAAEDPVIWQAPAEPQASAVTETAAASPPAITATYSGRLIDDEVMFLPCRQTFQLSETAAIGTTVLLNGFKTDSSSPDSTIGIRVTDAEGGPVSVGRLELRASGGQFLKTGTNQLELAARSEKQFVVWRQPREMDSRAVVQAIYEPGLKASVAYQPSRAILKLPVAFPRDTRIETEVESIDAGQNRWAVRIAVSTSAGKPVSVGNLRLEASSGRIENPVGDNLIALSQTPQPLVFWEGPTGSRATIAVTYYGDGMAPASGNRDYCGAVRNLTVPPRADLQAPVIRFTGIQDGQVSSGPVTVGIRVSDNMEEPLDIHAFHRFDDDPAVVLPPLTPLDEASAYGGARTFSAEGRHVIDVLAMDAAGNSSREILTFTVVPQKRPTAEPE